jgi:hypothetical protein
MKFQHKQNSEQQQEAQSAEQQKTQAEAQEFATPEELLRHDALHTVVPPKIGYRLQESLEQSAPPPPQGWWRRLFGS